MRGVEESVGDSRAGVEEELREVDHHNDDDDDDDDQDEVGLSRMMIVNIVIVKFHNIIMIVVSVLGGEKYPRA